MKHQLDYPSTELCPQCEADDGDFYNGLAIGDLCDECKAFNKAVDEALLVSGDGLAESIAWQIGKDRGYSNVTFALPEAVQIAKTNRGSI